MFFCFRREGANRCTVSFWFNLIVAIFSQVMLGVACYSGALTSCSCPGDIDHVNSQGSVDGYNNSDQAEFSNKGVIVALGISMITLALMGVYNFFKPMNSFVFASTNSIGLATAYTSTSLTETLLDGKHKGEPRVNKYLVNYIIWNIVIYIPLLAILLRVYSIGTPQCVACCNSVSYGSEECWQISTWSVLAGENPSKAY
ncbi:hypothetical protein ACTA71_006148 [Dictyostelium dimigraforme]